MITNDAPRRKRGQGQVPRTRRWQRIHPAFSPAELLERLAGPPDLRGHRSGLASRRKGATHAPSRNRSSILAVSPSTPE